MSRRSVRVLVGAWGLALAGAAPASLADRLRGDIVPTHDPVLIREGGSYYSYSTGQGARQPLVARTSLDLTRWRALPSPLGSLPEWATRLVPGARGAWAPDVSFVDGRYRLYYSVSTFGSRRSAIGLASSPTLDPAARGYGWRDDGPVVVSTDADDWNAIDPNLVRDREGGQWLAWGSFWSGLKIARLDPATGRLADPKAAPIAMAARPAETRRAIEGAFVIDHGGFYWLLASFDFCCRGARSDYHLVVGRSRSVTGPYLDAAGRPMLEGGGTVFLKADPAKDRFRGPGHAGFLHDRDGADYLIYHAYDSAGHGRPTMRLSRVGWRADGWPTVLP